MNDIVCSSLLVPTDHELQPGLVDQPTPPPPPLAPAPTTHPSQHKSSLPTVMVNEGLKASSLCFGTEKEDNGFEIILPIAHEPLLSVTARSATINTVPPLCQLALPSISSEEGLGKYIFYHGCGSSFRPKVWSWMFGLLPWSTIKSSTESNSHQDFGSSSRDQEKVQGYRALANLSSHFADSEMMKEASVSIEKDLERTDPGHSFYGPPNGHTRDALRSIVLIWIYHTGMSARYAQGMLDLASCLYIAFEGNEPVTYWAFHDLMTRFDGIFHPNGNLIQSKLTRLWEIISTFDPQLAAFLSSKNAQHLLFCYRWFIVLFRREFSSPDLFRIWEAIFSNHASAEFEIFVAVGMLQCLRPQILTCATGDDVLHIAMGHGQGTFDASAVMEQAILFWTAWVGSAGNRESPSAATFADFLFRGRKE